MIESISDTELAEVCTEAGARHHAAFIDSDGVDPEWPLFYAAHIQTRLWDRLGVLLTRSELVHVLVGGDLAMRAGVETDEWPQVYARRLREFASRKSA